MHIRSSSVECTWRFIALTLHETAAEDQFYCSDVFSLNHTHITLAVQFDLYCVLMSLAD